MAIADHLLTRFKQKKWVSQTPFTSGQWVMTKSSGFTHNCACLTHSFSLKPVRRWSASDNLSWRDCDPNIFANFNVYTFNNQQKESCLVLWWIQHINISTNMHPYTMMDWTKSVHETLMVKLLNDLVIVSSHICPVSPHLRAQSCEYICEHAHPHTCTSTHMHTTASMLSRMQSIN